MIMPAPPREALAPRRTIRVFAAQPLMLSTFTPDAVIDATTGQDALEKNYAI